MDLWFSCWRLLLLLFVPSCWIFLLSLHRGNTSLRHLLSLACSVYNNIHHPSKLAVGADFHCFKNKIEPKWEDHVCSNRGNWTACFSRGKSDASWLYTLLAMVGEQFDYGDEICGAVGSVRTKQEKIALWTKNAANEAACPGRGKEAWQRCQESLHYVAVSEPGAAKGIQIIMSEMWAVASFPPC